MKEFRISDFIQKPLRNPAQLLFSVENALEKQRLEQQVREHTELLKKMNKEMQHHHDHLEELVNERTINLRKEIDERTQAEKALRDHQQRLAATLKSIGDAVITTDNEGMITFMNTDNGCGIAPQHVDKLFDPFFSTKEAGKGAGLGLSISYSRSEAQSQFRNIFPYGSFQKQWITSLTT